MSSFESNLFQEGKYFERIPEHKIIVYTGIPGSGKDLILSQYESEYGGEGKIATVSFGDQLVKKLKESKPDADISKDDLRRLVSEETLKSIAGELVDEIVENQPVLVNTHVVYKRQDSFHINYELLNRLAPKQFVFVWAEPTNILKWRNSDNSRSRDNEGIDDIALHQNIALSVTKIIAEYNGASFDIIRNVEGYAKGDVDLLASLIKKINES